MKIDDILIVYLAHMLDECRLNEDLGNRSYWAIWLKEYPQYRPNSLAIKRYLAELFDRRMQRIDGLEDKLKNYVQVYTAALDLYPCERIASAVLAAFGPGITDRNFFWEPIPARTYKAVISRNRARTQG